MRFNEERDATESFSIDKAIGMGKMGIMYEGRLPNGWKLPLRDYRIPNNTRDNFCWK